jgi:hypothetical protein
MAIQKIYLSTLALCAQIGKNEKCPECGTPYSFVVCGKGEYPLWLCASQECDCDVDFAPRYLSIGDKLPEIVWECDHCEEKYNEEPEKCSKCFCSVFNPNPHLTTVKAIQLVERCETCRHGNNWHYEWHGSKRCKWAAIQGQALHNYSPPCECKQFKPMQMVEITVES